MKILSTLPLILDNLSLIGKIVNNIYKYYFSINDITKIVCRKFLLNTINIAEKVLRYTRDNKVN